MSHAGDQIESVLLPVVLCCAGCCRTDGDTALCLMPSTDGNAVLGRYQKWTAVQQGLGGLCSC